jgi:hypothetical protein
MNYRADEAGLFHRLGQAELGRVWGQAWKEPERASWRQEVCVLVKHCKGARVLEGSWRNSNS